MVMALREVDGKASMMRQEALSEAPASKGQWCESSLFEWIADGDGRLGPIIEVMLGCAYYWVPFDLVESLRVATPCRAMDLVWAPVELKMVGHPMRNAYMPSRYVLPPEEECDDALLTGTKTLWQESSDGLLWRGYGRKVWYVDGEAFSIFEANQITFEV
jgi:type VI secretion system protein ImpE